jgi:hypothetical protein
MSWCVKFLVQSVSHERDPSKKEFVVNIEATGEFVYKHVDLGSQAQNELDCTSPRARPPHLIPRQ